MRCASRCRSSRKQLQQQLSSKDLGISQEQLRQQAEQLQEILKSQGFQFDQKQLDEFKQQMEQFRQNFNPQDFTARSQTDGRDEAADGAVQAAVGRDATAGLRPFRLRKYRNRTEGAAGSYRMAPFVLRRGCTPSRENLSSAM